MVQCFFFSDFLVSVFFVSVVAVPVAVPVVPPVPVTAAPVPVTVAVVSVELMPVVVVAELEVSVVDMVPVVPVVAVSVEPYVDEVEVEVRPVSVAAVSVLAFSCFLQPTAKIATATSATRVITRDFFIGKFSSIDC